VKSSWESVGRWTWWSNATEGEAERHPSLALAYSFLVELAKADRD
jgi:hypothetical protein